MENLCLRVARKLTNPREIKALFRHNARGEFEVDKRNEKNE